MSDRVRTRTSCPSSAYISASGLPRKPVPPAMMIFIACHGIYGAIQATDFTEQIQATEYMEYTDSGHGIHEIHGSITLQKHTDPGKFALLSECLTNGTAARFAL